jgi:hypothetical protein
VQAQLVGDLCGVHGVGQVLLVGKHQQHRVAQLVLQAGRGRQKGRASSTGQEGGNTSGRAARGRRGNTAGREGGLAGSRAAGSWLGCKRWAPSSHCAAQRGASSFRSQQPVLHCLSCTRIQQSASQPAARPPTSFSILCSSSRASPMRSRSLLSTTKIRPCVFWK